VTDHSPPPATEPADKPSAHHPTGGHALSRPLERPREALGRAPLLAIALAGLAVLLPAYIGGYWARILSNIFMYAAMAQSLNIMAGFMGYADFGNTVFFGVGAYATALLTTKWGWPVAPAIVVGGLCGVALASVMGLPLLRLRGHYFAIATIGVLEGAREIVANVRALGGGLGISLPLFAGTPEAFSHLIYYVLLAVLLGYTGIAWWLSRSKFGYALRAIKADEEAAAVMGVATTRYKIRAWQLSAMCTGLVGGIYAYWLNFIEPPIVFDIMISVKVWLIMLLGGAGTVLGPIAGALILELLTAFIWSKLLRGHMLILGAVIVLVVVFMPGGFMDLVRKRFSPAAVLADLRANKI
jgi:branched-chain amino acid transport system permease protein